MLNLPPLQNNIGAAVNQGHDLPENQSEQRSHCFIDLDQSYSSIPVTSRNYSFLFVTWSWPVRDRVAQ
jgi:hypothetical protein